MINGGAINSGSINSYNPILTKFAYSLADSFSLSDSVKNITLLAFIDNYEVEDSGVNSALVETTISFSDLVAFEDTIRVKVLIQLTDLFSLQDTVSLQAVVQKILDTFSLEDQIIPIATVKKILSDLLSFTDALGLSYVLSLSDSFSLVDGLVWKIRQLVSIADSFSLSDLLNNTALFNLILEDSFLLEDSLFETIQKVLSLNDSFSLVGQFNIDGETYIAWAVNPKTFGAYKLRYPSGINSVERIGGKSLLVAADGIYEVGGDDDDGGMIDAFLKTGFEDFNDPERHYPGEKLKQLLNGYLVLSSEGETLLKVTTTRRGEARETWFKCREKPEVMAKKQVALSNSLRSVLFQFELVPLKGKPAKFREIEIIPLFLNRSI